MTFIRNIVLITFIFLSFIPTQPEPHKGQVCNVHFEVCYLYDIKAIIIIIISIPWWITSMSVHRIARFICFFIIFEIT